MYIKEMEKGLKELHNIYDNDLEDINIINDLFKDIRLGDIGKLICISKKELEFYEKENMSEEEIYDLSLVDNFCIIPYPSDIEHDFMEDYLIFLRGTLDGTRGEMSNQIFDVKYFIDIVKEGMLVKFVKDTSKEIR